jgi:FtsH-binding integral membrane protein
MNQLKQRHGCLTSYIILMIVVNSALALAYLLVGSTINSGIPPWAFVVLGVFAVFNLICAIALFKWKRWGFWGFIICSVVALIVNLIVGMGITQSLFGGVVSVALLYGVLHIGKENKGWPQLD